MLVAHIKPWLMGCLVILAMALFVKGKFLVGGSIARGVVIERTSKAPGSTDLYTLISFITKNGEFVQKRLRTTKKLSEGQRVSVIYKNNNPANAYIFRIWEYWMDAILIGSIIFLFWTALSLMKYHLSKEQPTDAEL